MYYFCIFWAGYSSILGGFSNVNNYITECIFSLQAKQMLIEVVFSQKKNNKNSILLEHLDQLQQIALVAPNVHFTKQTSTVLF